MNEAPTKRAVGFYSGKMAPEWPQEVLELAFAYRTALRTGKGCQRCLKAALKRKYDRLLSKLGWTAT